MKMKNILVIGNSDNIASLLSRIILSNKATCFHFNTIFKAIRTIYSKKIDTVVISSKEIANEKIDFLDFIKKQFVDIKIIISFDNGINGLHRVPNGVKFIDFSKSEGIEAVL